MAQGATSELESRETDLPPMTPSPSMLALMLSLHVQLIGTTDGGCNNEIHLELTATSGILGTRVGDMVRGYRKGGEWTEACIRPGATTATHTKLEGKRQASGGGVLVPTSVLVASIGNQQVVPH